MDWHSLLMGFSAYLKLEKSVATHTHDAYVSDVDKLHQFAVEKLDSKSAVQLSMHDLEHFISWLQQFHLGDRSQARILSGIKAFYKFLLLEDIIHDDPTELIEGPKLKRKIPEVLRVDEMESILNAIDLSLPQGHRNRAILETMYACGLRVSEVSSLKVSHVYDELEYISVIGKGNKQRTIPIATKALQQIQYYKESFRISLPIVKGHEDILFLNRFGKQISRISIFEIVKEAALKAGIHKEVSPHTFRHSFATHLVEGGANLRAVQEMMGHESITTTEIYTHLDVNYLRETILQYHPGNQPVQ